MATEGLCEVKTADGYVCTATRTCARNATLLCENCGEDRFRVTEESVREAERLEAEFLEKENRRKFPNGWGAGAQAVDLHAKGRICPYCRANECADGMMNCLPCMQNATPLPPDPTST